MLYKEYSYTYSNLAAGGDLAITAEEMGASVPTGYYPIAIRHFSSGARGVNVRAVLGSNTGASSVFLALHNSASSSSSGTAIIQMVYGKNISRSN